jgi:FkbM family methyltransferase
MKSNSQFGQDEHVINTIYKGKRSGFFIEAGACDGLRDSNSLILERDYHWRGICVEPNPTLFSRLVNNRKCFCFQKALYNENDLTLEFIDTSLLPNYGWGSLVATNCHESILSCPRVSVVTMRLDTLLDQICAPNFIEYLSLDTEGSELTILKSFNFDKYKFGYITVEHNYIEENRRSIRELLQSKGYKLYRENVVDDDFILNDIEKYL